MHWRRGVPPPPAQAFVALGFVLLLASAGAGHAWDFRDEVYSCGTAGMTLAELQSAGITLVSHISDTHEWMAQARKYGIRGMPYISLYKVWDRSAPGGANANPFWSAVAMNDHPEWVYIGPDGERKRPFNNPYYPEVNWQSCTNTAGIADAYCRGAAGIMEEGAGGVFIDNCLPAEVCHGPKFGIHEHLYPNRDNVYSFKVALRRVQQTVKSFGPDSVVMLNVGSPWDRFKGYGDCVMLESFIFNVSVRPGPGGWVGKKRVQVKQWPQVLEWIAQTAPFVDHGGNIVALEYLPSDPESAYFSYACDKLANFLWSASCQVRGDVLRTLHRCRLQRASGPLREREGIYYRHYPQAMVAVNPTGRRANVRVPAPADLESLADAATDAVLPVIGGRVRLRLDAAAGRVYVPPEHLAEGHLREALVAVDTALEQAAPDDSARLPAELKAAAQAARSAQEAVDRQVQLSDAAAPLADALRKLSDCAQVPPERDFSQRLAAGEELSRDEVREALLLDEDAGPQCEIGEDGTFLTAGGVRWRVAGGSRVLSADGMGADMSLDIHPLHEVHGWLRPTNVLDTELTTDEPGRKVLRVTMDFTGSKTGAAIPGPQLVVELEARSGDRMLSVTGTVRNAGDEAFAAYFPWHAPGAGIWCSRPGEPATTAEEYVNFPGSDWTYAHRGQHGGPGLMIFTHLPQSYSPYGFHLYSEPRSGTLAPGESRSIAFEVGIVRGAWQHNPRAMGGVTRAQVYTSRAYGLATGIQPRLRLADEAIAGVPARVRLFTSGAALRERDLAVTSVRLLDANGKETVPGETTLEDGVALVRTKPSLRDDLYLQVVCQVEDGPGGVPPVAVAADLRPAPSLSMELLDDGVWHGSRGSNTCRLANRLLAPVSCRLKLEVPEGYAAGAPEPVTLGGGDTVEVPIEVTSDQPAAPPGAARVVLQLDPAAGAGEVSAELVFRPTATCPRIEAPALDGRLDDPAWQQAARLGPFVVVGDGSAPQEPTHALIGRDDDYLYVGFECMESRMVEIYAEAEAKPGVSNPAVHQDDSVEVFLDPPGEAPYLQLAANCLGAQKTRGAAKWEVATSRGKDRWTIEMRILLKSLGVPIEPEGRWGANFCRTQIRLKEHSAWSPTGRGFHAPDRFGAIIFE